MLDILIFLLFLIFFGSVVSIFLHISGIHCNTDKQIVKVDLVDIKTNLMVWREGQNMLDEQEYTLNQIHKWNKIAGVDCFFLLDNSSGEYEFCSNTTDSNCYYHYRNSECFDCNSVDAGWIRDEGSFLPTNVGNVCSNDAIPIEWSLYQRWFDCELFCQIPEHFKFDSVNGSYVCDDLDYCGLNATIEPEIRNNSVNQIKSSFDNFEVQLKKQKKSMKFSEGGSEETTAKVDSENDTGDNDPPWSWRQSRFNGNGYPLHYQVEKCSKRTGKDFPDKIELFHSFYVPGFSTIVFCLSQFG